VCGKEQRHTHFRVSSTACAASVARNTAATPVISARLQAAACHYSGTLFPVLPVSGGFHHLLRGVGGLGSFQDVQRQLVLAKKHLDCILGKFIGCRADHDLRDRTG